MKLPVIAGVIDRRILVNYRVDADVLARLVPAPLRPKLVRGYGMAGICLIRLKDLRPPGVPRLLGLASENAAHRIAVEWDDHGQTRQGVYIPRRDSSSWFNWLTGGRLFPGRHHRARFEVVELGERYRIRLRSSDGCTRVELDAQVASFMPPRSVFASLEEASAFFEAGALGYSASRRPGVLDGLELRSFAWRVEPMAIMQVASSFFDDPTRFPRGSARFDCALLMRGIEHQWHAREPLCVAGPPAEAPAAATPPRASQQVGV